MAHVETTVFISYRRADGDGWAQHLYEKLRDRGFNVFYDVQGLGSGSFAVQLLENVRSRAHFLVLLKPTTLDRCAESGDWMRQEIEEAITAKRNVVPILLGGFSFSAPNVKAALTGKLALLSEYHGHPITPPDVDGALNRLVENFLNKSLDAVTHPPSAAAVALAKGQQAAANKELKARLRRTRIKNQQLAVRLAEANGALAQFQCPKCGASKIEGGIGHRPHYSGYDEEWEYASYECGYATVDDKETGLCRDSVAGRAQAKIKEVKFSASIVASTTSIRPYGDAVKSKLLAALTHEIDSGNRAPMTYALRAEAHLSTGNSHEAIKDIYRSGELGGLRYADSAPLLKAMIYHIKGEWARKKAAKAGGGRVP